MQTTRRNREAFKPMRPRRLRTAGQRTGLALALPLFFALQSCSAGITSLDVIDECEGLGFSAAPNPWFEARGALVNIPMTLSALSAIVPMGDLNPPVHVYPTEHTYLALTNPAAGVAKLLAPAGGRVVRLYQPDDKDWTVVVQVDTSFFYYFGQIIPLANITVGSQVQAGQRLGRNSGLAPSVAFGVYNFNRTSSIGILNTCSARTLKYADSPLKYFEGPTQQALYDLVKVQGLATKDGRIDYDESGKLVGNWVVAGSLPTKEPDKALAFVYNVRNHALRISIGSSLAGGGVFAVQPGATDFALVMQGSGQTNYRLFPTGVVDGGPPGAEIGVLAVQLISDGRIQVEFFPGILASSPTFTGGALIYDR